MFRSVALVLLSLIASSATIVAQVAPPRCDYGEPHPNAPAELSQFAFLVGDYEITLHAWQGDGWSPPRPQNARWNGWYGLGGMAIYDEWYDPDPAADPGASRGVNVRFYDSEEEIWKMMWISTAGRQVQDLRAQIKDGKLTMWQVHPERPGFRAVFEIEDEDHWARISFTPDEGTGEWTPQYRLAATRIPCDE